MLRLYLWPPTSPLGPAIQRFGNVEAREDLLQQWEATSNEVPDAYEVCIIHGADPGAGTLLAYAVYRKQIPTLLLCRPGQEAVAQGITTDLLTVKLISTDSEATQLSAAFLDFPSTPGRIFTFEGGDGAGKQTQTEFLVRRLKAEGYPVRTLDFPHDHAKHGALIREILKGKHGDIPAVNPLLFASIYAFNRLDTAPLLHYWLKRGYNVVLDRYSSANWGHQASKYDSDQERFDVIETLRKFEHEWLGLPSAHRVFYLDLPPAFALKAMQTDATRAALDIHETAGSSYKNRVRDTFLWCCGHFPAWTAVPCVELNASGAEERVSRETLHERLYGLVAPEFVNKDLPTF